MYKNRRRKPRPALSVRNPAAEKPRVPLISTYFPLFPQITRTERETPQLQRDRFETLTTYVDAS
jgi:hypothetical protein